MSIENINKNQICDDQLENVSGGIMSLDYNGLKWVHYQNQKVNVCRDADRNLFVFTDGYVRNKGYYSVGRWYHAAVYIECPTIATYNGWYPDTEPNGATPDMFITDNRVTASVTELSW